MTLHLLSESEKILGPADPKGDGYHIEAVGLGGGGWYFIHIPSSICPHSNELCKNPLQDDFGDEGVATGRRTMQLSSMS